MCRENPPSPDPSASSTPSAPPSGTEMSAISACERFRTFTATGSGT
ncbi:MAG: hypothetical protein ACR2FU_21260 [Streptosporangiaceae bacterium]